MSAAPDEIKTNLMVWLKRYIVNIPVALLMLAMALRLEQGFDSPVSTAAAIGRWLDTSPDVVIIIMAVFGVGALFAPSRWHLLATATPLIVYAGMTFWHSRIAEPNVVPDVAWVQQMGLAVFVALWIMFGRPFPDEELVTIPDAQGSQRATAEMKPARSEGEGDLGAE